MRTRISSLQYPRRQEFVLDLQVIRLHQRGDEVLGHERIVQVRRRAGRKIDKPRRTPPELLIGVWRRERSIAYCWPAIIKRKRVWRTLFDGVNERVPVYTVVEISVAATNDELIAADGLPCETDSGGKVIPGCSGAGWSVTGTFQNAGGQGYSLVICRRHEPSISSRGRRVAGNRNRSNLAQPKIRQVAVFVGGIAVKLPSKAEIQGQSGTHLVVVLDERICVIEAVPVHDAAGRSSDGQHGSDDIAQGRSIRAARIAAIAANGKRAWSTPWQAQQKVGESLEQEPTLGNSREHPRPLDVLEFAAEADGMFPMRP